jgi:hypothetical protein
MLSSTKILLVVMIVQLFNLVSFADSSSFVRGRGSLSQVPILESGRAGGEGRGGLALRFPPPSQSREGKKALHNSIREVSLAQPCYSRSCYCRSYTQNSRAVAHRLHLLLSSRLSFGAIQKNHGLLGNCSPPQVCPYNRSPCGLADTKKHFVPVSCRFLRGGAA